MPVMDIVVVGRSGNWNLALWREYPTRHWAYQVQSEKKN